MEGGWPDLAPPSNHAHQIVPMVPKDKSATVLVNMGWVPTEEKVRLLGVCSEMSFSR